MTGNGGHLPLGEFRWAFDQATAAVGLAGVVPHGLRHSAASLAISGGANIKVVQRMLGHKTATLTLDLYGHLFDDDLGPVADAMNRGALAAADELRTKTAYPAADDQRDTGSPAGS
ncbi:tyrosine-type recombinase/integrase [Nocardia brasiliensis]|uniref:tyrosine-type recombinase/integrase n=1 Tax=Nocardia brasiliensis TaxID=37326 RepID=UPI002B4AC576|nr:tyrosine-type recombinase/integrase [Nocardia brasiliensis]